MDNQTATTLKQFAERFVSALERIASALEQPPSVLPLAPRDTLKAPGDALPIIPASAESVAAAPIPIGGHGAVFVNMTDEEIRKGTKTFPGTEAIAKAMNDAAPMYTFAQVKAAVMAYQDKAGWAAAQSLLKGFGATFIKDLAPKDYGAVIAKLAS